MFDPEIHRSGKFPLRPIPELRPNQIPKHMPVSEASVKAGAPASAGASAKSTGAPAKKTGALAFWPKLRLYRFLRIRPKQLRPMLWPINEAEAPAGARSGGSLFLGSLDAFFRSLASL